MCAQGVKLNTTQNLKIGANQDADTLVCGFNNEITLIEKTDMVVGARAEGTAAVKVEAVVGAALSAVGGLRADMTLGYKYDRIPMGAMEVVGGYVDRKNVHVSTVGTVFFVGAGTSAAIKSPNIALTASEAIPEVTQAMATAANSASAIAFINASKAAFGVGGPPVVRAPTVYPSAATSNTSTLQILPAQAQLTGGANPTTQKTTTAASLTLNQSEAQLTGFTTTGTAGTNTVCLTSASLLCQHQTEATFGTATNYMTANKLGVNITGVPGVILNGVTDGVTINGSIIKLGEPVVTSAGPAAQTAAAEAAAAAAAAVAATAAAAARAAQMASWSDFA
jgi:hypothetical protein